MDLRLRGLGTWAIAGLLLLMRTCPDTAFALRIGGSGPRDPGERGACQKGRKKFTRIQGIWDCVCFFFRDPYCECSSSFSRCSSSVLPLSFGGRFLFFRFPRLSGNRGLECFDTQTFRGKGRKRRTGIGGRKGKETSEVRDARRREMAADRRATSKGGCMSRPAPDVEADQKPATRDVKEMPEVRGAGRQEGPQVVARRR